MMVKQNKTIYNNTRQNSKSWLSKATQWGKDFQDQAKGYIHRLTL